MPGLTYSSNWKKLQETLSTGGAQGTKRKRTTTDNDDFPTANGLKPRSKPVQRSQANAIPLKRRKMGSSTSRPESTPSTTDNATQPSKTEPTPRPSTDSTLQNTGLHPTHKTGKYLSLDCEMVGTGPPPSLDNILARVSIVNYHGEQIYDTYVLPRSGEVVTDYRTHVSGIRPSHLVEGIARPFAEVQGTVASLLKERVLVGHALRNDLNALILGHPKRDIRDTARYSGYRKMAGGKAPSLRKLTKMVLGKEIQGGEHSSVEDARAAMELFKREREGIEVECRRMFGASGVGKGRKGKAREDSVEDAVEAEEEVEDDDEEGSDAGDGEERVEKSNKKKRKKKKRTKRA